MQTVVVGLIFALTWILITGRNLPGLALGRTGGALAGAVAMVAVGALSPTEAFAAIDSPTIALLLGMMAITAYLERDGVLDALAWRVVAVGKTPMRLLVLIAVVSAFASALLVNDTVCLFMTPAVIRICRAAKLPFGPYLIAIATSANIGSAATLVGNPQNMIIGSLSGLSFLAFFAVAGPAALAALVVNVGLLQLYFAKQLPVELPTLGSDPPAYVRTSIWVISGVAIAFFMNANLGFSALAGAVVLMAVDRRDPSPMLAKIDFPLLVFFASLFIVVRGLDHTGLVDAAWAEVSPGMHLDTPQGIGLFSAFITLASNVVSNAPLVLLVGPRIEALGSPLHAWTLLAFVATLAGNFTLVGSVANLIVAERAKHDYILTFWEYFRFGAVSTIATSLVALPILTASAAWFGGGER